MLRLLAPLVLPFRVSNFSRLGALLPLASRPRRSRSTDLSIPRSTSRGRSYSDAFSSAKNFSTNSKSLLVHLEGTRLKRSQPTPRGSRDRFTPVTRSKQRRFPRPVATRISDPRCFSTGTAGRENRGSLPAGSICRSMRFKAEVLAGVCQRGIGVAAAEKLSPYGQVRSAGEPSCREICRCLRSV